MTLPPPPDKHFRMHAAVCSRHENTLLFAAGTRTTLQFIGLVFGAADILWCNMAAAKFVNYEYKRSGPNV
jgi:hypothetical protein